MVKIAYKHIIRILDLIDEKIVQLENDKSSEYKRANFLPYGIKTAQDEKLEDSVDLIEAERVSRFDKIIEDYKNIKEVLSSELDRIEFKLGIEEKQWNQNQHQNNPQNQPNH